MLAREAIVTTSPDVMPRVQPEGTLLYHTRTDEMHVVSPSGYAVYQLCGGGRTVGELAAEVARSRPEFAAPDGAGRLDEFLVSLADRRLVEIWG